MDTYQLSESDRDVKSVLVALRQLKDRNCSRLCIFSHQYYSGSFDVSVYRIMDGSVYHTLLIWVPVMCVANHLSAPELYIHKAVSPPCFKLVQVY